MIAVRNNVVGDLDLPFESVPLPADPGQNLLIYTPEPESPSHDALQLLSSWAATADDHAARHPAPDVDQRAASPKPD